MQNNKHNHLTSSDPHRDILFWHSSWHVFGPRRAAQNPELAEARGGEGGRGEEEEGGVVPLSKPSDLHLAGEMTERSDFRVSLACLSNVQIMGDTIHKE